MEFSRHKNFRNPKYLNWLREQKCLVSNKPADCAHHVRLGTNGGKGIKPSDYFCIPLTHEFHTKGPRALHLVGEQTFLNQYKIDITSVFISQLRRFLTETYQYKSNQMFDCPYIEINFLVGEIEVRRPIDCLKKKKKIKVTKNITEDEFYQKAKKIKREKDKELRASLKDSAPKTKKITILNKENSYYQKAKELKKVKEKELREKNKDKLSEIRKDLYQKSKALKKQREEERNI